MEPEVVDKMPLKSSSSTNSPNSAKQRNGLNSQDSVCCGHSQGWMPRPGGDLSIHVRSIWLVLKGSKIWWLLPSVIVSIVMKALHLPHVSFLSFMSETVAANNFS